MKFTLDIRQNMVYNKDINIIMADCILEMITSTLKLTRYTEYSKIKNLYYLTYRCLFL